MRCPFELRECLNIMPSMKLSLCLVEQGIKLPHALLTGEVPGSSSQLFQLTNGINKKQTIQSIASAGIPSSVVGRAPLK